MSLETVILEMDVGRRSNDARNGEVLMSRRRLKVSSGRSLMSRIGVQSPVPRTPSLQSSVGVQEQRLSQRCPYLDGAQDVKDVKE